MKNVTEHQWKIEPSEEVILKFLHVIWFPPYGENQSNIHLLKREKNEDLYLHDLATVKGFLSYFMLDNIASRLFRLHNSSTNKSAIELYRALIESGMPLEEEYNLLRLHEAIIHLHVVDPKTLHTLVTEIISDALDRHSLSFYRESQLWDLLQCFLTLARKYPALKQDGISWQMRNLLSRLNESDYYPGTLHRLAREVKDALGPYG